MIEPSSNAPNPILYKAIVKGNLKSVQYWINKGENIESKNSDGQTAFQYAVSVNRLPIVEFLLQKGAKIEEKDKKGHTPLNFAVARGFKQVVEILIKHEANIDLEYLLLTATKKGCIDIVKILIAKGANLEEKDAHGGFTPPILATLLGESSILEILLQNGANVEA